MDEKLKETLNKIGIDGLQEVKNWLSSGKDFVSEQTPLVIEEIITWGVATNLIAVILWIVWLILATILIYINTRIYSWTGKQLDKRSGDNPIVILPIATTIVNIGMFVVGIYNFVFYLYRLVFVLYAPRLYILEQLGVILDQLGVTK